LVEIHRAIVTLLTPQIPPGFTALTDEVLETGENAGACRIIDRIPVDPETGAPIPEQYQHRGAVVTIPSEDNSRDTRGRETEGMLLTVVVHGMYRTQPHDQTESTYDFWRWEEAIRRRIRTSAVLRQYRPQYVGTQRGQSRASAEWLTCALTFTFYRYTAGA
jgi:hypothetical protein